MRPCDSFTRTVSLWVRIRVIDMNVVPLGRCSRYHPPYHKLQWWKKADELALKVNVKRAFPPLSSFLLPPSSLSLSSTPSYLAIGLNTSEVLAPSCVELRTRVRSTFDIALRVTNFPSMANSCSFVRRASASSTMSRSLVPCML